MRYIFVITSVLFLLTACEESTDTGFEINGTLMEGLDGVEVFLYDINKGRDIQKSIVKDGRFRFFGRVEGIQKFLIHDSSFKSFKAVWLDNSSIVLEVMNSDFESASTSGSQTQDQGEMWDAIMLPLYKEITNLNNQLESSESINDSLRSVVQKKIQNIEKEIVLQKSNYIREHLDYQLVTLVLFETKEAFGVEQTKSLYTDLQQDVRQNYWGKKLDIYLNHSFELSVGDKVPVIRLPDIDSNLISIESLRGNYVLLEFWESSCQSCSDENSLLRLEYKKYHQYGFEIYAVSLDQEKSNWKTTLERDSVIWLTVSDLKGLNGDIAIRFKIEYLPLNYLIDPNGVVVLKNVRGSDLSENLERIYAVNE